MLDATQCWKALVERDATAEFIYAVVTTGVFCRPMCPSRLPRRQNVRFFDNCLTAREAGFRPCKRCAPEHHSPVAEQLAVVERMCALIDAADVAPALHELASAVGLSASYAQRVFKSFTGISPKQYAAARRWERLRTELQAGTSVTEAVYAAGWDSPSRFYATSNQALGMTARVYRKGASGMEIRVAFAETYLDWVVVATTEHGICAILLGDSPDGLLTELEQRFPEALVLHDDSALTATVQAVVSLLEVPECGLALPLDIQGTAFQRRVWDALRTIPAGSTLSYAELAQRIGQPEATRAVAQACGANALAVAIPCHRVLRSNGELGGYRWGVDRKRQLLERESS